MTPAGHDSITAAAEWCQRAGAEELMAFGLPYNPLTGRYRIPSEKTLREVLGRLDPSEMSPAGFSYLRPLPYVPGADVPKMPDGVIEREQRRAHHTAIPAEPVGRRRRAIAMDGKCLRSAKGKDGSQVFVLSAVRHGDGITLASREIRRKDQRDPGVRPAAGSDRRRRPAGCGDHCRCSARPPRPRHLPGGTARSPLSDHRQEQPEQARGALHKLPWKDVPVIHHDDARGHGRREERRVQVVTANGLLFPHARQVLRIQRKRRLYGAKKWSTETVYAITDPADATAAEDATAAQLASWARGHWTVENTVHWVRDVVFGEDKSQVRTHNTPAVLAAVRDLIRGALHLAGYVNTAAARRAHTERHRVHALYGIT